ncbi:hypothetical protein D3C83_300470 [compost metagenome]
MKVGSGITTETPGRATTASTDWISSFDPFATSTPSFGQSCASETAAMKSSATKGG